MIVKESARRLLTCRSLSQMVKGPWWRALIVAAYVMVFARSPAFAATSEFAPSLQAKIVAAVEHERKAHDGRTPVPGWVVGVWDDSGRSFTRAFGFADLAKRIPMTTDDHFRIGSNTKTFIISVLLQLVDEGRLKLDDPLSKFSLGVKIPNAQNITVREVCQMRSGLFEAYDTEQKVEIGPNTVFDPRTVVSWGVQHKPYFAPGNGYKYSNTNYLILGLLIQSITKDTYGHQIKIRLLDKFGLNQTSIPDTQAMPTPWSHGYALTKNGAWQDISGTIPVSLMWAAGAMISNMADMRRWMKLYVTGTTNSAQTQRAKLQCLPTGEDHESYGLGIYCSKGWFGYTGGLPGYNTAEYYMPAMGFTVISWAPFQRDEPFPGVATSVVRDIARILTPHSVPFH